MQQMKPFPNHPPLTIDSKGYMEFTAVQWKWFLKFAKSKAKTFKAQQKVVKKVIMDAINHALKVADETNTH